MRTPAGAVAWQWWIALAVAATVGLTAAILIDWTWREDARESPGVHMTLTDADIDFAQRMSAHHQQAITMVEMLGPAAAPDVRAVAEQIRTSQWREIGALTGWLELAGEPMQPPPVEHGQHAGHSSMPGMASNEELTRLGEADGVEREVLFLQLMVRHHQGGIEMAADVVNTTAVRGVRSRALSMVRDQRQEIALMTVTLDQRGESVLPYP